MKIILNESSQHRVILINQKVRENGTICKLYRHSNIIPEIREINKYLKSQTSEHF